jgi:hypothetical protein
LTTKEQENFLRDVVETVIADAPNDPTRWSRRIAALAIALDCPSSKSIPVTAQILGITRQAVHAQVDIFLIKTAQIKDKFSTHIDTHSTPGDKEFNFD